MMKDDGITKIRGRDSYRVQDGKTAWTLTVLNLDYHRNGISGVGFHAVKFLFQDPAMGPDHAVTLFGVVFDFQTEDKDPYNGAYGPVFPVVDGLRMEPGLCAIVNPEDLGDHYRGDHFETVLRRAIKVWTKRERAMMEREMKAMEREMKAAAREKASRSKS